MTGLNYTDVSDVLLLQTDDRIITQGRYGTKYIGRLAMIEVNLGTGENPYIVHFTDGTKQYASTIELAN